MSMCVSCPRNCGIDREQNIGYCSAPAEFMIGRAGLHFDEEPCISGTGGAGTVFFSGCSMHCIYCQNEELSRGHVGKKVSAERLLEIFEELKEQGAHNLDLVTPSHYTEALLPLLKKAPLPIVWNSSGYDKVEMLQKLEGKVDVYLPDFKYMDADLAAKYSNAPDYPEVAQNAIKEMVRQTGPCVIENGLLKRGVMIRHLVLPGAVENSLKVIDWIKTEFSPNEIMVSLMSQYTPYGEYPYEELNRSLTKAEYIKVRNYMRKAGLTNGYEQALTSAKKEYTPEFDLSGV